MTSKEELQALLKPLIELMAKQLEGHPDVYYLLCGHVQGERPGDVSAIACGGNVPAEYVSNTLIAHAGIFAAATGIGGDDQPAGHA